MADSAIVEKVETKENRVETTRPGCRFLPRVDILETPEEMLLLADVPGAAPETVDIHYEKGVLTIQAAISPREPAGERRWLLREYGVGDFVRRFEVGEGIDATQISAEISGGVLTVHLPKSATVRSRKIAVRAG
jgi:HSP20 family protein